MPRKRRPQGPDIENGRPREATHGIAGDSQRARGVTPQTSLESVPVALSELWCRFIYRDDGYLRLIPDDDADRLYLKWKYTRGRWCGHYAFVSGPRHEWTRLLDALSFQLDGIAEGLLRPTKDRIYE